MKMRKALYPLLAALAGAAAMYFDGAGDSPAPCPPAAAAEAR